MLYSENIGRVIILKSEFDFKKSYFEFLGDVSSFC